jgi:basic amino acid/polyamine antiporter, APA family
LIKMKRNGTIKAKVIGYPVLPIIFLLFSIILSVNTMWVQPRQAMMGLLLIASGVPFYYYFNSRLSSATADKR